MRKIIVSIMIILCLASSGVKLDAAEDKDDLEKKLTDLNKNIDSLSDDIDSYDKQIADLEAEITDIEANTKEHEDEIASIEQDIDSSKDAADAGLISLQSATNANIAIEYLFGDGDKVISDLNDYYTFTFVSLDMIDSYSSDLNTINYNYNQIDENISEKQAKIDDLNSKKDDINDEIDDYQDDIDEVNKLIADAEKEDEEKEAEKASKEEENETSDADADEADSSDSSNNSSDSDTPAVDPNLNGNVSSDKQSLMAQAGISESDYTYVDYIITRESGWDYTADNPYSSAYGICQALPGNKMSTAGSDWATNPVTQLRWCDSYAVGRYGSWSAAYNFWIANNWW